MTRNRPVIAIDGPAGAGKSTAARMLAAHLGFIYVDTGALYRGITFVATSHEIPLNDGPGLASIAQRVTFELKEDPDGGHSKLLINGQDRSKQIREQAVEIATPVVAKLPEVREVMTTLMRRIAGNGGAVLEGRDIGTVVFPDAEIKIFLVATLETRAIRHHAAQRSRGIYVELANVIADIRERDRLDTERESSPLKRANDAELLDTSELNQSQVLDTLLRIVRSRALVSTFPRSL